MACRIGPTFQESTTGIIQRFKGNTVKADISIDRTPNGKEKNKSNKQTSPQVLTQVKTEFVKQAEAMGLTKQQLRRKTRI